METKKYSTIQELIFCLDSYKGIHLECNPQTTKNIYQYMTKIQQERKIAYLTKTDRGYERDSVKEYLKFFHAILAERRTIKEIYQKFDLEECLSTKIRNLEEEDKIRVQFARISMQKAELYYIEEPLLWLGEKNRNIILTWIWERFEEGKQFITTNSSLRHALLLPGTSFYIENNCFYEVEKESEEEIKEEEIQVLKIPAKLGNRVLLFEPKEIDFIESLNKANYLYVRGSMYQVSNTLEDLERTLEKSGFFRSHRSYLVNIQKVERIEKITKNSYTLVLDNYEHSQIPLSKGRIEKIKEYYDF